MFFSGGGSFNPFKSSNEQTGASAQAGSYVDLSPYIG